MIYFNRTIILTFVLFYFSIFSIDALEKDKLVSFLKEYDASQEKYSGKIAFAIERKYPDVAEFLIQQGESINEYAIRYPLSFNPEEYKLSSDLQNVYIKHPLTTAIRNGYNDVAHLMIHLGIGNKAEEYKIEYKKQFGAARVEIERKNAMYIAIEEGQDSYDIVLNLLENGFDVNTNKNISPLNKPYAKPGFEFLYQCNSVYITPLLQAIAKKKLDICVLLLDHGAKVDMVSQSPYIYENNGYRYSFSGTPLLKAVDDDFIQGVLLLLSYGANPSVDALERATQKDHLDIVDVLYDAMIIRH